MSWIRVFLAVLVLALLGGAYYYFDYLGAGKEPEETGERLLGAPKEKITSITIDRPGEERIRLKKAEEGWRLVEPVEAKADTGAVKLALEDAELMNEDKVIEGAADLSEFGLDDPVTLTFAMENGAERVVRIGGLNPMGDHYYVMGRGEGEVVLVSRYDVDDILKNVFDFRDKKLFAFSAGDVTRLVIEREGVAVAVEAGGEDEKEDWRLVLPIKADADDAKVESFVSEIAGAKAAGFIDEKGGESEKYGLAEPGIKITLNAGKKSETLLVGAKTEGGGYHAMLSSSPAVFRIPPGFVESLPGSAAELRDKSLVKVDREKAREIIIERPDQRIVLKAAEEGEDPVTRWRLVEPIEAKADASAVNGLIFDVERAEGVRIAAEGDYDPSDYGLGSQAVKVTIKTDKDHKVVRLGKTGEGGTEKYYAAAEGADTVLEIDEETYAALTPGLEKLRDRRLFSARADEVGRVVVERGGQVFEAATEGEDRYLLKSPRERALTVQGWNEFVWAVLGLEFEKEPEKAETPALGAGFDSPTLKISVYGREGALRAEVTVGAKVEGEDRYYARVSTDGGIYEIPGAFVSDRMYGALERLLGS
ncbi:MAG: DUF4340 domain-containing protein [Candidatus Nitrospinota bacterium M3_3B_026]